MAVVVNIAVNRIVVEELFTFRAPSVVLIAAVIANINIIAVIIDSQGNFIGEKIFIALCAKQIFLLKATGANVRAVVDKGYPASVVIFLTMLAEAVIFVETTFANVNALAVTIDNFPSFGAIIFAIMAELATIVIAILTEKFRRNFIGTRNAKSVSPNIENLEVVGTVLANGNFGVEVRVRPVCITTKTVTARDMNGMFIATIFFGLPEVRNAFKFG